jgi:ribonuclease E
MQISNQIVMEFFSDEQNIQEMVNGVQPDEIDNDESDYDDIDDESDDDIDDESDESDDDDIDDESDDEKDDEKEQLHQFYRQDAEAFNNEHEESESYTDVLDDNEDSIEPGFISLPPPAPLRREQPSDYITPFRPRSMVVPNTPSRTRVLNDITNIMHIKPRRLSFN